LAEYWFCSGVSPTTLPFQWLVASSESRCGIARIWVGVWSLLPPPIWISENEHGWHVVHCASAAAIFIGWYVPSITPSSSPTSRVSRVAGTSTIRASLAERVKTPASPPCRSCQAETASITAEPVTSAASTTLV
jgi:hypothetical protein